MGSMETAFCMNIVLFFSLEGMMLMNSEAESLDNSVNSVSSDLTSLPLPSGWTTPSSSKGELIPEERSLAQ